MIKKNVKFTLKDRHDNAFQELIMKFKERTLFYYFDMNKQTDTFLNMQIKLE